MWLSPLDLDRLRNSVLWAGGLEQGERELLRQMIDFWEIREKRIEELERQLKAINAQRITQGG